MQESTLPNRRRMLVGSTVVAAGWMTGCREQGQQQTQSTEVRTDVPLRVCLVGSEEDVEAILRGWGAVTDQPLKIERIEPDRSAAANLANAVTTASATSDVMIYPLALVAPASADDAIIPLSDEEFESINQAAGELFPSVRSGAGRYAGQKLALPLGGAQPAVLAAGNNRPKIDSWAGYDELVRGQWSGSAGEPTGAGWAAAMFLWRAATSVDTWLFSRDSLDPLLNTDPYVEVLDQMTRTHKSYQHPFQTPDQVWRGVVSGQWRGGIGFPVREIVEDGECSVSELPGTSELSKVLFDPFSPVISLSSQCRQSETAKRFIEWISGGEGSEDVHRQVGGMTKVRRSMSAVQGRQQGSEAINAYRRWLVNRLESSVTLPTLQLIRAGDYYQVLENQVTKALGEQQPPRAALQETASQWRAITEQVGPDKQRRAWRRAQGMRA